MRIVLVVLLSLAASAAVAAPKRSPARRAARAQCPARRADVKPGASCPSPAANEDALVCSYPKGAWCACEPTRCVSAAGPVPDCKPAYRWVCRDDGCPHDPRGACAREGQRCAYDDGLCDQTVECEGGRWVAGAPNCRPAAPPQHP